MDNTAKLIYNVVADSFNRFDDIEDLARHIESEIERENKELQRQIAEKPFGKRLVKEVFSQTSPHLITLSAHLVLEALVEMVVRKKFPNAEILFRGRGPTYASKVDLLFAADYISKPLFEDLRNLGRLRNRFAHDLDFELGDFDLSRFTDCEEIYEHSNWEFREARSLINLFLIRHIFFAILVQLSEEHPYLADIPSPDYVDPNNDEEVIF